MRRIFTPVLALVAFLSLSLNSSAQCGPVYEDFSNGASGFTATAASGTFSSTGGVLRFNSINSTNGLFTITTPTLFLPNVATSIDFGFTTARDAQGSVSNISVAVRYVNTSGAVVTTSPVSVATNVGTVCSTLPIPADIATTGGSARRYQLIVSITASGGGQGSANVSFDNYRTSSISSQIVLPVHISRFDAKVVSGGVSLNWVIDAEEKVRHYEVERSAEGYAFNAVGTVAASGRPSYQFTDLRTAPSGFYRIKAVDIDGKVGYSTIIRIKGEGSAVVLKAFPLPARNVLTLQHDAASRGTITIASEDGRLVKQVQPGAGAQQTIVDISILKPGLYLVRFDNGNGGSETLKVVKQ
jgi:hypothetical protein